MEPKIKELPAYVSYSGRPLFYISKGFDETSQYMRSDGKWMTNMDGRGEDWASGGTYFSSRDDAEKALAMALGVGPVRTVTRQVKEIVPGTYGRVRVTEGMYVHVNSMSDPVQLRAAAATLIEIADALDDQ